MPDPAKKPATYCDIEALPEHKVGEIVDGELYVSPRPASWHALASSALGGELYGPFQLGRGGPGGWWILDEPELHFGGDVLVPDLAGWRRERMPRIPRTPYFTQAPDWVCETLSSSTAKLDLGRKLPVYAKAGVSHAWILDPLQRSVEAFVCERKRWVLLAAFADDESVRAEPFEAIEIRLPALFPNRGD